MISHRSAFTLVEVIVVSAFISILAAILFPVVISAKRHSADAVAISNLRQCGMALLMYSDDYGGLHAMPTRPAADELLSRAPTCDPRDYFRSDCEAKSPKPMIGSFAYVRDDWVYGDDFGWSFYLRVHEFSSYSPALLINLFTSNKRHIPGNLFGEYSKNPHPDQIQMFEADGGVRLYHPRSRPEIGYSWQVLFTRR